jgi:hypothetical protein
MQPHNNLARKNSYYRTDVLRRPSATPAPIVKAILPLSAMTGSESTWAVSALGSDAVSTFECRAEVMAAIPGFRDLWLQDGSQDARSELVIIDRVNCDVFLADLSKPHGRLTQCGCYLSGPVRVPTRGGLVMIGNERSDAA